MAVGEIIKELHGHHAADEALYFLCQHWRLQAGEVGGTGIRRSAGKTYRGKLILSPSKAAIHLLTKLKEGEVSRASAMLTIVRHEGLT